MTICQIECYENICREKNKRKNKIVEDLKWSGLNKEIIIQRKNLRKKK